MSENGTGAAPGEPAPAPPPHLDESVRRVRRAAKDTVDSARLTGRALRTLVSADLALARSAFGRAMAWVGIAIVFGASAWLLLAATLIAFLQYIGLSLFVALLITTLTSLGITGYAVWRVSYFFHHTGMHATRRQLSRLGLFDEPGEEDPDADVKIPEKETP